MPNVLTALAALAALAASPVALLAQEHEAPTGGLLSLQTGLMFWTLFVFLIVAWVLRRFAFGPITAAVRAREAALEEAIAMAKKDRDDAAKLLADQKSQIESARNEAQRFIAEGRAAAENMKAQMLEQTRVQQGELLERARRDIDAEKTKAIDELRSEAVDLAIAGAGKVIEKNLDDAGNRKLVETYLAGLGAAR